MYGSIPPLIFVVPQDSNLEEFNSLRASLLTVLRVVYATFRLSSDYLFGFIFIIIWFNSKKRIFHWQF